MACHRLYRIRAVCVAYLLATNVRRGRRGRRIDDDDAEKRRKTVDEKGGLLHPELNAGLYYELYNDIDFAGEEFTTIFNKGVAFNGHIEGKGHSLKNISISVTKDNLDSFIYKTDKRLYSAHIAMFGDIENAEIANVSFKNLKVEVAPEVIDYVAKGEFSAAKEASMDDVIVGSVAGVVNASKFSNISVDASVKGAAYARTAAGKVQTYNTLGGVAGLLDNSEVYELEAKVSIETNAGTRYYVGGAFGYVYDSKVEELYLDTTLKTNYENQLIYFGGAVGFANTLELTNATIALDVKELGEKRFEAKELEVPGVELTVAENSKSWIAGIVNAIRVDNASDVTKIINVKTVAKVDFDGIFAGAVMDIFNKTGLTTGSFVELTDIIVDSDVVALKAYAFARSLSVATINLVATNMTELKAPITGEIKDVEYNVRLTGYLKLKSTSTDTVAAIGGIDIDRLSTTFVSGKSALKVIISSSILDKVSFPEKVGYGVLESV